MPTDISRKSNPKKKDGALKEAVALNKKNLN